MSIKKIWTGFLCAAVLLMAMVVSPGTVKAAGNAADANELKVGAAIRDITPTEENGMLPMTTGLARQTLVGVIDPLHVRVIAMNDGEKTALMVVWETGDSPAPTEFVDDLAKETGVDREAIFYCATHSHAVPDAINMSTTDPWMVYAHDQMIAAAKEAIANMEPATVGIGYTNSYINVNRNRTYYITDGTTRRTQGYNPEGLSDKTLALIRFDSKESGEPVAFIVNYAVHGVVMYANHYIVNEDGTYGVGVSADLPGYVSTCLENSYDGSVALWISGAAGDQNPIIGNEYFVADPETGSQKAKTFSRSAVEILEFLGSVQYADVLQANKQITETSSDVEISYGYAEEYIPGYAEDSEDFRASLHKLQFGDIALLGSSGELFCEYGLTLKEESSVENTLVVNHAATYNDEYRTYMCTDTDLEIGQGQGVKKVFAAGYLSDTLVDLMQELEGTAPAEGKTAADYYSAGDTLKNKEGNYEAALEQFVLGAAMEVTDESKEAVANCLVQIGECCVRLQKGPNGETGEALRDYVLDCWERAGELGNGTGYFDLALSHIGLEVPGAGFADCLGLANDAADQKKGFDYLQKALELKNGKAMRYIGICYENGYGVEQSYEKAYECYTSTGGAQLYIARYQLFGIGGAEQDMESAIASLKQKAESMSGGNRTETQTARLILAELYYTGSYSETLYDGSVATATVDELDKETALLYLGYHQDEHGLSDEEVDAIVAGFDVKILQGEIAELKSQISDLENTTSSQASRLQDSVQTIAALQIKTAELEKKTQELEAAEQELANVQFTVQSVTLKKATPKSKQITVSWTKISGADGYEISYSLKASFKSAKKVTVGSSKAKTTIKKLTKGKKYYVRVRAYKNVNGTKIYTQYSARTSARVK